MHIQIIYAADCPHWQVARDRLIEAVRVAGISLAAIELVDISHADHWVARVLHGSPTILIDGADPFATLDRSSHIHCRIYSTGSGFEGAPGVDQLVVALSLADGRTIQSLR